MIKPIAKDSVGDGNLAWDRAKVEGFDCRQRVFKTPSGALQGDVVDGDGNPTAGLVVAVVATNLLILQFICQHLKGLLGKGSKLMVRQEQSLVQIIIVKIVYKVQTLRRGINAKMEASVCFPSIVSRGRVA